MAQEKKPSWLTSTVMVLGLTVLWIGLRTALFGEQLVPLTFVVPMLICVWTRRVWQLWAMAAAFSGAAIWNYSVLAHENAGNQPELRIFFGTTLVNILVGGLAIQLIIALRAKLDERNERLREQNAALEAQAEELARQNEEIKVQSEELAQQNEEIESQTEELGGQNEELQHANERLAIREEILQSLLEVTRTPETGLEALEDVCRRSLHAIGKPAECIAVLRLDPDMLRLKAQASVPGGPTVPAEWPREGSIASAVLAQEKTAYVSDLAKQPELAAPFRGDGGVGSILATPLRVAGVPYGLVVAISAQPAHWTQEQFHVFEWIAAQCGLIAEGIRWQKTAAERTRQIEAANRAKDQFLAMLSHELRTPLTPVLAAAGVLERDERIPADAREDLRMIRRNVAIQSRLIDDLLDLTKIGRGKLELDLHPLDLAALLRETAGIVAVELDAKDQGLVLDLAAAEGGRVLGDGPRLQQVFWNLLKNASKFSPAKSRIVLRARVPGAERSRVEIDVVDTGMGIEADNLQRIFLPFEQVEMFGKQRGSDGGLGLGLAIAKAIVELHKGTIRVASEGAGRGTTFTVDLPLLTVTAEERMAPARPAAPLLAATEKRLRILLVEDHDDTGRVLARLLRNGGYAVDYVQTAAGARELFEKGDYDLLISDLGLPDESGLELMKRLRALRVKLAGICLSGYGTEEDLQACRDAGFDEHLTKPVDLPRLLATIARVMGRER